MDLTETNKKHIDGLSYQELLCKWRNTPSGDPWFTGETGSYWAERMKELSTTVDTVQASKNVGWR